MPKRIVDVPVHVDESALLQRGWHAVEARARVTTDTWSNVAVSLTLEFLQDHWTSRFVDPRLWVSPVVLEVSSKTQGETIYVASSHWDIDSVGGRAVRDSISGTISYSDFPIKASDLYLRLTSFDAADVGVGIRPLPRIARRLDIQFEESATDLAVLDLELDVDAYVTEEDDSDGDVVVYVRGMATLADYGKLVEATVRRDEGHEEGEFEIKLPDVQVDVLDDTDFLLSRLTGTHYMEVNGSCPNDVPKRAAEWVDFLTAYSQDLPGDPSSVVVRLVDRA